MAVEFFKKYIIILFILILISLLGVFSQIFAVKEGYRVQATDVLRDTSEDSGRQIGEGLSLEEDESSNSEIKGQNILPETEGRNRQINNYSIDIPSISLKKNIVPNVDPANKSEYMEVLTHSVAHGKYTLLPDEAIESGNIYLFAHRNGEYNGRDIGFFRNLDKIRSGQEAYIDFNGYRYVYKYRSSKVVSPKDTYVYTAYSSTPTLTLQTCESGYSKRLILVFDYVGRY